jgi:hypothetical protein
MKETWNFSCRNRVNYRTGWIDTINSIDFLLLLNRWNWNNRLNKWRVHNIVGCFEYEILLQSAFIPQLFFTLLCFILWSSGQSSWLHDGDELCFLWGTNWIDICYVEESRPSLWSSGQSSWLQNGDVLCFLWGTNWIDICYVEESRPPLWSSGQSSWLHNGCVLCFLW